MSTVDQRVARGDATRAQILNAARDLLRDDGYAGATTRAVADRADVRLSLVHYHFGGKGPLLAALLEEENARLLARQRALYESDEPLADKWRSACRYLREDLWELWAAGLADEELARRWREAMTGWRDLLTIVVASWAAEAGVELPMSPRALATLVANAFQGAEVELLAGVTEDEAPHFEAFDVVAGLIETLEAR
jgi:AcrR family transcriptional regulator